MFGHAIGRAVTVIRDRRPTRIIGAARGFRGLLLSRAMADPLAGPDSPLVYLVPDDTTGREIANDVAFFAGLAPPAPMSAAGPILLVPSVDVSPYADVSPDPRVLGARMAALRRMASFGDELAADVEPPQLIVLSVRSLVRRVVPPNVFSRFGFELHAGQEIEREWMLEQLISGGYTRVDVVEDPGTFSVRGGILDVYVPSERFPTRIEWFGDEVERMRYFLADSQRSLRDCLTLSVHPVRETVWDGDRDLRTSVLKLGDELELPSTKTRQVLDNLKSRVDFFGIEAIAPLFHDELVSVLSYLPKRARIYADEVEALGDLARRQLADFEADYERAAGHKLLACPPADFFVDADALAERIGTLPVVGTRLEVTPDEEAPKQIREDRGVLRVRVEGNVALKTALAGARAAGEGELLRPLAQHLRKLAGGAAPEADSEAEGGTGQAAGWDVLFVAPNMTHAERLASLLRGYQLVPEAPRSAESDEPLEIGNVEGQHRIRILAGALSEGFSLPDDRILVLSESDIFGRSTRRGTRRRTKAGVASLGQLSPGDFVVHMLHGVGRYEGLVKLAISGQAPADFVHIAYSGKDKLYLPVHRISQIERYQAADGKAPKLDKLGGQTFQTKTKKIKSDVRQMAEELLQIYAQREAMQGHAYPEVDEMYQAFEATFPFEETPDQDDAIQAVQGDLSRPQPMDRLVCGDVGFGKTEVALRAAFRVASAGKQVAVLAPTTVLVQQHFQTFTGRMASFPVEVGCLNRFASAQARKNVVHGIADGTLDVVVGTHRLLSKDVRFRDLGLVIIDEEQRFGVAQKERFKRLKTKVDVLTLTATPIPRTLHMGLLGMREISMIATPPADRLAIRTYVARSGDVVIEEGVRRELARGGQVFYVVPRIVGIEEHAKRIRGLVPEARVSVAHGKMPAEILEKTMVDFVEHRSDVLVSTTIIESGIDIPRANTMFIERADMFGMAQLYQLRGRIGRSRLRAHCYLMVNSLDKLTDDARKRLEAIQRYSELGSGFSVASADLELRGAGDILGKRQSGSIAAIGFEAYARILREAVAEVRGDPIVDETDPELTFDRAAFLPDTYVQDTAQRLDFYRRLSLAAGATEVREVMEELEDRYGAAPVEAQNFGRMMACKTYAKRLGALSLEFARGRLVLRLGPHTPMGAAQAARLADTTDGRFRLVSGDRIVTKIAPELGRDAIDELESCERALSELSTLTGVLRG